MSSTSVPISTTIKNKKQKTISNYFNVGPSAKNVKLSTDDKKEDHTDSDNISDKPLDWTHITRNKLNISYSIIMSKKVCQDMFAKLETEVEYFTGHLAQVKIFG
jgi:hypothetical protein